MLLGDSAALLPDLVSFARFFRGMSAAAHNPRVLLELFGAVTGATTEIVAIGASSKLVGTLYTCRCVAKRPAYLYVLKQ